MPEEITPTARRSKYVVVWTATVVEHIMQLIMVTDAVISEESTKRRCQEHIHRQLAGIDIGTTGRGGNDFLDRAEVMLQDQVPWAISVDHAQHALDCGLHEISQTGYRGMKQVQFDTSDELGFMLELVEYESGFEQDLAAVKERLSAGETVDGLRYMVIDDHPTR